MGRLGDRKLVCMCGRGEGVKGSYILIFPWRESNRKCLKLKNPKAAK